MMKTGTFAAALNDLWDTGPGALCDDCGHFAARHRGMGCNGIDTNGCTGHCQGMLRRGHRFEMNGPAGPVLPRPRDGSLQDTDGLYEKSFVLEEHDPYAAEALLAYADACEKDDPNRADELRLIADRWEVTRGMSAS